MSDVLNELLDLLQLETLEQNLYRGQSQNLGWGRIFGGQVVGQALSAASHTVPSDRVVHSLHAYFLRTGEVDKPIVYEVDRIRDGRSFTTRRVVAIQDGRAIFNLAASFQVEEEGFEHADPMPPAPEPEDLLSEEQMGRKIADRIPPQFKPIALARRPIEIRPAKPLNPFKPVHRPPTKQIWLRAAGPLPDDPAVHRYLLAYASDFQLLTTALQPHGVSWISPRIKIASVDHAMWFHRPFKMDEWLLYDIDSPSMSGGRALVRGRIFDRSGSLVASVAQEGLTRDRSRKGAEHTPAGG